MPPVQSVQMGQAPSVWQKLGMGAMMGTGVGLCIGFIGGSVQILRAGPGPKGAMGTLAQFMGTSAATFGFFMSIGTVIRTESAEVGAAVDEARLGRHRPAYIVRLERMQRQQKHISTLSS